MKNFNVEVEFNSKLKKFTSSRSYKINLIKIFDFVSLNATC